MHTSRSSLRSSCRGRARSSLVGLPRLAAVAAAALAGSFVALAPASPAAAAPIDTTCAGDLAGTTFTLTADCATTEPLIVPATIETVDGGGFTISATDTGGPQWNGAIVTNAAAGQTMNIRNVTITGPDEGFQLCTASGNVLYGIFFNDASGTVSDVTVDHIFQFQNFLFGSCQTGRAIRADALTAARTVTITDTVVTDYQKSGFEARGSTTAPMTMTLSGSTAGPPHPLNGFSAQNAVSYVGASGTIADNTIIGSGDQGPGLGRGNGTAVLLSGANNVTIDSNTITGVDTNIGVSVSAGSTDITISFNEIGRTGADALPDDPGIGIAVDPGLSATLICNTFSGWITNVVGALQISCDPLPDGAECVEYSADVLSVEGGTAPFTWSVSAGTLPPGLAIDPATGEIAGVPTAPGTFDFTVQVADSSEPALTAVQPKTITIAPNCEADLALTKVVSNATPNAGDQVTFTVTLTNNGPDTATNVQVTDLVPAGMTLVSATPSQGIYDSATGLWTVGTVTTATPQTLQLVVTVVSTSAQTNAVTVSASDQPDPNAANNSASAGVAPPVTTAPTTTLAGAGGVLPPTGNGDRSTTYIALAALALGSLLLVVSRRRAGG